MPTTASSAQIAKVSLCRPTDCRVRVRSVRSSMRACSRTETAAMMHPGSPMQKGVVPLDFKVCTQVCAADVGAFLANVRGMRACLFTSMAVTLFALASPVQGQDAQALRARHAALRAELADNPFGRPLYVESSENAGE